MKIRTLIRQYGWLGSASAAISIVIILAIVFAPYVAPHPPTRVDVLASLQPPSAAHPFGTDDVGRDILSRMIFGGRISLLVAFEVVGIAVLLGGLIGIVSGYVDGWLDEAMMRLTDVFLAFPQLILAMAFVAALGPGISHTAIAVALVWWPGYARLFRGQTITLKNMMYVEAAHAVGASNFRVMRRHILPNSLGPATAKMTMDIGYAILALAGLSFIGLGAQEPHPEWGLMIALASKYVLSHWWYPALTGAVLTLTVVVFTLTGDAIEDRITK